MARSERVTYWRGKHRTKPQEVISGRLLFEEDTGDVFLDFKDYIQDGELHRVQLTDTRKMDIAGGTFEGPVFLYRTPEEDNEATPKSYVDAVDNRLTNHDRNEIRHITEDERVYWNDKVDNADYRAIQTTGHRLGVITINDEDFTVYAPITVDIEGNSGTATKLKNARYIDGVKFDGTRDIIHYGRCDTTGSNPDKIVEIPNFKLTNGSLVIVLFAEDNIAENPTLKVNDEEPYPIRYHRDNIVADEFKAGAYQLVYTGTVYEIAGIPNIRYDVVTSDEPGLMTSEDKQALDLMKTTVSDLDSTVQIMRQKLDTVEENANAYELPVANDTELGGVIIGENIAVDEDGTISITYSEVVEALGYTPSATESSLDVFEGATDSEDGETGFVPKPYAGYQDSLLRGNGTWLSPSNFDDLVFTQPSTEYVEDIGTVSIPGHAGFVPSPTSDDANKFLRGDGSWVSVNIDSSNINQLIIDALEENNETVSQIIINALSDEDVLNEVFSDSSVINNIISSDSAIMEGASAEADGSAGSAPKPIAGDQSKFLRGDGTWASVTAGDVEAISIERIREICTIGPSLDPSSSMYMQAITNEQIDEICD